MKNEEKVTLHGDDELSREFDSSKLSSVRDDELKEEFKDAK